jgi:hypothetical protein
MYGEGPSSISWKMLDTGSVFDIVFLSQTLKSNAISPIPRPRDITELEIAFNAHRHLS